MNSSFDYASAVNRAKEYISNGLQTGMAPDFDGQNILVSGDNDFKSTVLGVNMLRQSPSELFEWAGRDATGFEAAKRGLAEALEQGEELPKEAIAWLVKFLREEFSSLRKKTGPKGQEWKHLLICEAIRILESEGMLATRNDWGTNQASACDVVADALAELGLEPYSFDGVKDVWKKRDKPKGRLLDLR